MESRNFEQIVAAPRVGYADSSEARDYNFKAGNTQSGRPVYYVVEEPDSLHADRSPYNFEPADNQGPKILLKPLFPELGAPHIIFLSGLVGLIPSILQHKDEFPD